MTKCAYLNLTKIQEHLQAAENLLTQLDSQSAENLLNQAPSPMPGSLEGSRSPWIVGIRTLQQQQATNPQHALKTRKLEADA
jgi:hypothetical protein